MLLKQKLLATAAGATVCLAAANASAQGLNLGEVWVGDQFNGLVYIADQGDLNNPFLTGQAATDRVTTLDLQNLPDADGVLRHSSTRMHIIGFSNHAGLDDRSRAVFGFLDGWMEIWKTNGGTHAPEKVVSLQVLGGDVGGESSLHMCGPSPDNTKIGCSSIGGRKAIIFDADMDNDVYTRLGDWDLNPADIPFSSRLKGKNRTTVMNEMQKINDASLAESGNPNPGAVCNNFSTDSNTLYYTVQASSSSGGVVVLDVTDPSNPTIIDAWQTPFADGCGLVNTADGKYMWMNHGHNTDNDQELASKWDNRNYLGKGAIKNVGPVAVVDIPERADSGIPGRNGDVHGAQFAGLGGPFLWEVMRIDDRIHVIDHNSRTPSVVNTIDLEADMGLVNPQPDVLDRSALGTSMYFSTRGFIPTTAITGFIDLDRDPGIVTYRTLFGKNGEYMKTTPLRTGIEVFICEVHNPDPGDHDHDLIEVCEDQSGNDEHTLTDANGFPVVVDTIDPHGLKSLSFVTGGF